MSRQDDHADGYDLEQEEDDLELDEKYMEISDEDLRHDIKAIEDPVIQKKESENAIKLFNEKKALRNRLDRGEINMDTYDATYLEKIKPKITKAKSRCAFASVRLNWDDFGDVMEDIENLPKEDTRMAELKDGIKEKISVIGPDAAQELADRLHEEEVLSKDAHDRISRQVRIQRRNKQ